MTKKLMLPKRKLHVAESQLAIESGRKLAARYFSFTACIVDHFVDGGEAAFGGIHVLQFLLCLADHGNRLGQQQAHDDDFANRHREHLECEIDTDDQAYGKDRLLQGFVGVLREDLTAHRLRSEEHTSELQSLMRISYTV